MFVAISFSQHHPLTLNFKSDVCLWVKPLSLLNDNQSPSQLTIRLITVSTNLRISEQRTSDRQERPGGEGQSEGSTAVN